MVMSSENKQQILYDSFDMFKDDWDNNVETLTSTIAKIATIDLSAAIQMWLYLLNKHSRKIKTDAEISSGILNELPEESYGEIVNNNFLIETLFKHSNEPWESVTLISHFLMESDYYTVNKLLELVSLNMSVSKYNYTDYKSSNLSTCLYKILYGLYILNDNDIEFFSAWIERVEDKNEKMKLKVLMISKEANGAQRVSYSNNRFKNDYLIENASLEDLDLLSYGRDRFEIKKLIEMICNNSINYLDISRLDIRWIIDVFAELNGYSKTTFNIIGAYFLIYSYSRETYKTIEKAYKDKMSIKAIAQNSNNGDTESLIKQRLDLVISEISNFKPAWDFNTTLDLCSTILSLSKAFQDYITKMENSRAVELDQFCAITVSSLGINTRINKILLQNNILMVSQLIKLLDSDVHLDGLGHKSIKILHDKVESLGIKICSVNDDLNFIFNKLDIKCDAKTLKGTAEVTKKFKIHYDSFSWNLGRQELQRYIDIQSQIAYELIDKFYEKSYNTLEYLALLRKDDESIYLPGPYFFSTINKNNPPFPY